MADNFNAWNSMLNASKQMMDSWMEMFSKKEADGSNFDFQMMADWMKIQKQWMDGWTNWSEAFKPHAEAYKGPYNAWTQMMSRYNPMEAGKLMSATTRDVFEKMMNSNKLYLGIYEQWDKFNKQILKPGTEDYERNIKEMMDSFNDAYINNFIPLLPEEFQTFFLNPHEYFTTYMGTMQNFQGPWIEAYQEIGDILLESSFKDPTKISEALLSWKEAYSKTFGALVESPVVGSSREVVEQNNRAINAMVDMMVSFAEYISKSVGVANEHSKKAFEDYFLSLEKGDEPRTFSEFYKEWSKRVENAIEEYFYTDEFSKLIAQTADSAMVFKIETDKVLEKTLENTPIVTESEVQNVYKNIHDLKREIRELKKEIKLLKEKEEEAAPAKKTTTKTTAK